MKTLIHKNFILKFVCSLIVLVGLLNIANAQSLTITAPSAGAIVAGSVNVTTTNSGFFFNVSKVTFSLPGLTNIVDNSAPFSATFNTSTLAPGSYTITAVATDGIFETATQTVTILVIENPTASGSTCGTGPVTLTASDGTSTGGTYKWYTSAAGTTLLQSSTSTTYTTPSISSNTTYYVSYTLGGVTSNLAAVTATISTTSPVLSTSQTVPTTAKAGFYLSYPFTSPTPTTDISTNNNTAIVGATEGSPGLTADRYGVANNAYSLNGTTQYVATTTKINTAPTNFSISVWFKTTLANAGGLLVGYGDTQTGLSANYDRHVYMDNNGLVYFGINPASGLKTIATTTSYADGYWHHAVAVESTTAGAMLYIDGALQASNTSMTGGGQAIASGYWRIGYNNLNGWPNAPTNYHFNGSLDDISVFTSAIPASTVYTLYGAGSPPTCPGSPLTLQANTVTGASYSYSWSGPNGYSSNLQNPTVDPTANASEAGTYTVTVTAPNQCPTIVPVTAVIYAVPTPTITVTNLTPAANTATSISGTLGTAGDTYSWNFGTATVVSGSGLGPYSLKWSAAGAQTITLTETNANGCSTTVSQSLAIGGQSVSVGNYAFTQPITLKSSLISAGIPAQGISSTLYSFPALVYIQEPALIKSAAPSCTNNIVYPTGGTNGYDFAFTTQGSTTELFYQVESYNTTTGTLLVWVQVPALTPTDVGLNFYFGSTTPTHPASFTAATWSSDYNEVYHLNEGVATGGTIIDATSNTNNAIQTGCTSATGQISGAYKFNSSYIESISASTNITGSFTLSAWVQPTSFPVSTPGSGANDYKVITNETNNYKNAGYKLGLYGASASTVYPEVETRSNTGAATLDRYTSGSPTPVSAVSLNAWHYVQGVYDNSTGTFYSYLDGNLNYSSTGGLPSGNNASNIFIGSDFNAGNYLFGLIDEVRVSTSVKSADWIRAEYYNQTNPSSFTVSNTAITTNNLSTANTIGGSIQYTWTFGSTDVTQASNWNCTGSGATSILPPQDGTSSLIIPATPTPSTPNYPVLPSSYTLPIYSLTLASGAQIYLNGNTLNIGCHVYNNGGTISSAASSSSPTITVASTGGLNFISSVLPTQYLYGSTASGATNIANLTVANTGTVDITTGPVNLYNTLTMTSGNLLIDNTNSGSLTLISNASGSASVGKVLTTCTSCVISGQANVQRYITGGSSGYRGYRFLSSPVNITDALPQTTQHNIGLSYLTAGMLTGGPGGTAGGFTMTTTNPLIYLFDETRLINHLAYTGGENVGVNSISGNTPAYSVVTIQSNTARTLNSPILVPVGNAYLVYYVGIASDGLNNTSPSSTTVTATGYLNQGTIPVYVTNGVTSSTTMSYTPITTTHAATPGLHQIGNPYPSTIDLNVLYADNSSSITSIFDELQEPNGAYVSYNASSGATSSSTAGEFIVSGQGFFIHASAANKTLSFLEHEKVSNQLTTSTSQPLLLNQKSKAATITAAEAMSTGLSGLHLQLNQDSLTHTQTGIYFSSSWSDKYVPQEDGIDEDGASVYLSSYSSDNQRLSINQLGDYSTSRKVVKLYVSAASYGAFKLSLADIKNIDTLYNVYLRDHLLNDSVNLRTAKASYNFNITADTASYGSNRFDLVLEREALPPYQLLTFTGQKMTSSVQLNWVANGAGTYTGFVLEKEGADNSFNPIYTTQSNNSSKYSFVDNNPVIGNNIYRLAQNDINGNTTYSSLITIGYNNVTSNGYFSVYPNPSKSIINVLINSTAASTANYTADIYNTSGMSMDHRILNTYSWTEDISSYKEGVYIIVLKDTNGDVLAKSKFIKIK